MFIYKLFIHQGLFSTGFFYIIYHSLSLFAKRFTVQQDMNCSLFFSTRAHWASRWKQDFSDYNHGYIKSLSLVLGEPKPVKQLISNLQCTIVYSFYHNMMTDIFTSVLKSIPSSNKHPKEPNYVICIYCMTELPKYRKF